MQSGRSKKKSEIEWDTSALVCTGGEKVHIIKRAPIVSRMEDDVEKKIEKTKYMLIPRQ